jgi:hypothetical protein
MDAHIDCMILYSKFMANLPMQRRLTVQLYWDGYLGL